ncbi:MAG: Clp amino terminal domain protein [Planctomycetes bacterium ADurb.Bin126]|nr:MAG: Clp amino terminal domain protein [Planctomycetes bacterium ADurb.Bin126]HOD81435.1 Clp protease N-terminal domain-containing protein [Phycisphaerae bacterium]HQL75904.1 Clp protease N-terminal domain-containing protein [Phycisphaerae bacterium]
MGILSRLRRWWRRRQSRTEELSAEAKGVFACANASAIDLRAEQITTAHVLLGILRTTSLPGQLGVDCQAMEGEVLRQLQAHADALEDAAPVSKEHAKQVLQSAIEGARTTGTSEIGPRHLLTALCCLEGTLAFRVLANYAVTADRVRNLQLRTPEI